MFVYESQGLTQSLLLVGRGEQYHTNLSLHDNLLIQPKSHILVSEDLPLQESCNTSHRIVYTSRTRPQFEYRIKGHFKQPNLLRSVNIVMIWWWYGRSIDYRTDPLIGKTLWDLKVKMPIMQFECNGYKITEKHVNLIRFVEWSCILLLNQPIPVDYQGHVI